MPNDVRRLYWDANCFLDYIEGTPDRLPVLDAILDTVSRSPGKMEIVTSTVSVVEVAFAAQERAQRALDPEVEGKIDRLWADRGVVKLVEFHEL